MITTLTHGQSMSCQILKGFQRGQQTTTKRDKILEQVSSSKNKSHPSIFPSLKLFP